MKNVNLASKFVVQYARLLEIGRGGQPRYAPTKVLAVANSLPEARSLAAAALLPNDDAQILEVFEPVVLPGLYTKFLDPVVHPTVAPKPARKAKPGKAPRKAA